MTQIDIYPSQLKGRPLERHYFDGTLHDWMLLNVPDYKPGEDQPVSASVDGHMLKPCDWQADWTKGRVIEIRPLPREFASVAMFIGKIVVSALISMALNAIFGNKPKSPGQIAAPKDLSFADVKANTAKINQVIPEIAGRHRVWPDMLCQARKYFVDDRTQAINMMLCVGKGEFVIDDEDKKIGETPFVDIEGIEHEIFQPGDDVSGNEAHENWYNAPEVGATTGGYGLRLTAGVTGSPSAEAQTYTITGSSIVVPTGGGTMPQDWEVGNEVAITALTKSITVIDGGALTRDIVQCDLTGITVAVDDVIMIYGAGDTNSGQYKVVSKSSVSVTGTSSSVTAVKVSPLDFLASPISFTVNGQSVDLDDDYADHDDLVTAIDGQVGGVTVSHTGGYIKITDDSPFDGQNIVLAGYYDPVFGASPNYATGVKTESYDELTLDKWEESVNQETGEKTSGYSPAYSMQVGDFENVDIQIPRVRTVNTFDITGGSLTIEKYSATEYRITSIVTGTLPDGSTGTVGFSFQRLNPDGTDDAGWTGFYPETTTSNVDIIKTSGLVGGWTGPFSACPKGESTSILEIDVFAPSGLIRFNREGKVRSRSATYELQWMSDDDEWQSVSFTRTYATQDQLGWTNQIDLGSSKTGVKVRMRRIGAESEESNISDRLEWYGLKSKLPAKTSYDGVTTMALTISGSDLIAAQTNNQVNLIVTRKLNGIAERNIVPWVEYVLDSIGIDPANIDDDEMDRLHAIWSARSDYFDYAQLTQNNVRDVINRALDCGYASLTIDAGKIRPVRDEERESFEQSYSAQNMTENLKRSFASIRPDEFDGVDVTYLDPTTFVEKVIECRLSGDLGFKAEQIRADGITDETRAWRYGMRRRREQKYRRWSYQWGTEMDALNSRYLSYCAVIDDVPGYGRSGWIKDAYIDASTCVLTVSEPFEFIDGQSHVVAWRNLDGSLSGPYSVVAGSHEYELIATTTNLPEIEQGSEPPHVYFGTTEKWTHPVLITKISPQGFSSCNVEAVNYDGRIYADDNNSPPS